MLFDWIINQDVDRDVKASSFGWKHEGYSFSSSAAIFSPHAHGNHLFDFISNSSYPICATTLTTSIATTVFDLSFGNFFFYFSLIINQNTHLESSFLLWVNEAVFMEAGWRVGAWFFLRNCMNFTDSFLCSEVHITIFMYELRRKNCNFAMFRFQWKLSATFFRFQGKLSVTFSQ